MDLLGQLVESLSLSLLLLLAVCEWLSGSVLCCVSSVIYQVYREERQRERGREGETTPVAGRQQLPASWLSVLTPHLTSMGTEQPPLLSSSVGTRGQIFIFSPPLALLLLGCRALGTGPGQSRTWQDRTALAARPQRETSALRIALLDLKWHSWHNQRVRLSVRQPCSCLVSQAVRWLVSQPVKTYRINFSTLCISSSELWGDSDVPSSKSGPVGMVSGKHPSLTLTCFFTHIFFLWLFSSWWV